MILKILNESAYLRNKYFNQWGRKWTQRKIDLFKNWIEVEHKIVDIGCGNGLLTHMLRLRNYSVVPVDIAELTYSPLVEPIIYDGINLPFRDDEFHCALLITVLHHTENPVHVLNESARVAQNLVIMEDIYSGRLQKWLLFFIDALVNLGYSDLNFTHKTDEEWKAIFSQNGLEVVEEKKIKTLLVFNQIVYHVKRK